MRLDGGLRRRRHGRRVVLEPARDHPEADLVPVPEERVFHPMAVHEGPVPAPLVVDAPSLRGRDEARVPAGDGALEHHDLAGLLAADQELAPGEVDRPRRPAG